MTVAAWREGGWVSRAFLILFWVVAPAIMLLIEGAAFLWRLTRKGGAK